MMHSVLVVCLVASAMGGAGAVVMRERADCRVAIVGGGFAGLSAAGLLEREGIDYCVLEASERLGGRVLSIPYKSGNLQLGAEYINGHHNPIYEIAKESGVLGELVRDYGMYDENSTTHMGGFEYRESDLEAFDAFVEPLEEKYAALAFKTHKPTVGELFNKDYKQFVEKQLRGSSDRETRLAFFDTLADLYRAYYENEWSAPVDKLSIANYDQWNDFTRESASYTLNKVGFTAILKNLTDRVPSKRVHLNTRVENIDYTDDRIHITLDSGEMRVYDFAIVTVPLGHLKKFHHTLFQPNLPDIKRKAIETLGFGNNMKVLLHYIKPFWNQEGSLITLRIKGDAEKDEIMDHFKVFQPLGWDSNVLVAWISGDGPARIAELSDEELAQRITQHLRFTMRADVPAPTKLFRKDWHGDELFGGSYTFLTPQSVQLGDAISELAAPIVDKTGKPRVMFAGEATHPRVYQTTIGAHLTGIREAKRVANWVQLEHWEHDGL